MTAALVLDKHPTLRAPAALLLVALVAAACGGSEPEANAPTATAPHTATSPAPTLVNQSSVPQWVKLALGESTKGEHFYTIDVIEGTVWRLDPPRYTPSNQDDGQLLTWSPNGRALVSVTGNGKSTLYLGRPGGEFERLTSIETSITEAVWSPDGELVELGGLLILNPATAEVVFDLPEGPGPVIGWSTDSRYLAFAVGSGDKPQVLFWDRESGSTSAVPVPGGVWSNMGHRFAYGSSAQGITGTRPIQIMARNLDDGTDVVLTTLQAVSAGPISWSNDDELLSVSVLLEHVEDGMPRLLNDTQVIDTVRQQSRLTVHAAWPEAWLPDGDTLLVTGNVCTTFDIFTVAADGSLLQNRTNSTAYDLYAHVAPDGRQVAFTTSATGGTRMIRVLSTATGEIDDLVSGAGLTLSGLDISPRAVWSGDGRFVGFAIEGGHGICEGPSDNRPTSVEVPP